MRKNKYEELTTKNQEKINALPIGYCFNKSQFNEMMVEKFNLKPEDTDKIVSFYGGYCKKTDLEYIKKVFEETGKSVEKAIEEDKTGDGFILDMFIYELFNHEYAYTRDLEDTIRACGLTVERINSDKRLIDALDLATDYVIICSSSF